MLVCNTCYGLVAMKPFKPYVLGCRSCCAHCSQALPCMNLLRKMFMHKLPRVEYLIGSMSKPSLNIFLNSKTFLLRTSTSAPQYFLNSFMKFHFIPLNLNSSCLGLKSVSYNPGFMFCAPTQNSSGISPS